MAIEDLLYILGLKEGDKIELNVSVILSSNIHLFTFPPHKSINY